jgi:light-regulated signal transduction histidine kinase (bacteriophytochrome)
VISERRKTEELIHKRSLELEAANRELEAFSYSVSHDLRAPLRAIDGFSRIIVEDYADKLDASGQGYLNRVRNAVQRMGILIDDLLELSRVGRFELHPARLDLSRLASEVMEQLQTQDTNRQADIRIAPHLRGTGDEMLLRLVLQNLLGNAWKFTANTRPAIIEFGAHQENGQSVYFVRDNGAGFDMQFADKLFGVFQRLHKADEFAGSGVGLATVQRIIQRHGGKVWAEAKPGKGASFYFTLPQAKQGSEP